MNPQWFSFSAHLLRRLNSPGLVGPTAHVPLSSEGWYHWLGECCMQRSTIVIHTFYSYQCSQQNVLISIFILPTDVGSMASSATMSPSISFHLDALDIAVVVIYFIVVMAVGIWASSAWKHPTMLYVVPHACFLLRLWLRPDKNSKSQSQWCNLLLSMCQLFSLVIMPSQPQ